MNRYLTTTLLLFSVMSAYTQDLPFEVKGAYARSVRAEKLEKAVTMSDLINGYPVSWIDEYVSTSIAVVSGDHVEKAESIDDNLTPEQVSLLQSVDLGDDVVIDIAYKSKNFITKELDVRYMHYAATVIPEHEAEYPGGVESMRAYLKENAIINIPNESFKELQQVIIRFTVDEQGQVTNPRFTSTTGDSRTDNLLLKALKNMPGWKPAVDGTGKKVAQDFEFIIGNTGC
ncbi:MAG TPA: energy transducer TonB [Saprospiraceae bacterium]|nr:energy transducer TonB [Saprospiraceae bacterium]